MKILFTNFHDGDGGGHTTYLLTLATALAPMHQVHVAAPLGSRLYREAAALSGVHVWAQAFPHGLNRLLKLVRARRQLKALLREQQFDIVHVNGSADHSLVLSSLRGLAPRPQIVWTKHNSKSVASLGHRWRARHGTDQVIAVCDYTCQSLQASPYRHCRLATVYNGVDTAHFAPWPAPAAERERQRWVQDPSVLLLGSNAGTASYKGWMDLVEALALLVPDQREQIHLLLAGALPSVELRQRIATLGLSDKVHFAGPLADVRPMIAAVDIGFVLSWSVETISFACREMMAMGKPVLVSTYAGLPENVQVEADGWLVPPRDHAAMAAMLQQLLRQRAQLPAMGMAARRHAEQAFGLSRFVERTEAVYLDLLAAD